MNLTTHNNSAKVESTMTDKPTYCRVCGKPAVKGKIFCEKHG